jgi:addiction module HigA family antidote
MTATMSTYTCQRAIHPGEILKEEVEYRGIKQTVLAEQMDLSYKMLNDILNCRRPLTATTALLFEAALGVNAGLLMRMQLDYNMQTTQQDKSFIQRLERIKRIAAVF